MNEWNCLVFTTIFLNDFKLMVLWLPSMLSKCQKHFNKYIVLKKLFKNNKEIKIRQITGNFHCKYYSVKLKGDDRSWVDLSCHQVRCSSICRMTALSPPVLGKPELLSTNLLTWKLKKKKKEQNELKCTQTNPITGILKSGWEFPEISWW